MQRVRTHPGEIIKELYLGEDVMKLINGERSIDAKLADKLAEIFGTTVEYWLNLQRSYDESLPA